MKQLSGANQDHEELGWKLMDFCLCCFPPRTKPQPPESNLQSLDDSWDLTNYLAFFLLQQW